MKHKTNQTLVAYWNEVRGNRIAPRRFDIEPARIGSILPETFILERLDAGQYRFRLAGTKIFETFGIEFRGTNFLDLWTGIDREIVAGQLASLGAGGAFSRLQFDGLTEDGRSAQFEAVLLPLTHGSHVIDRIVGSIGCLSNAEWIGHVRLDRRRLSRHEIIRSDRTSTPTIADRLDRQSPFAPHLRGARLVRSERRQFRVYDGGLSKGDDKA